MNNETKDYLIQLLQEDKPIPENYQSVLFPVANKEYRLSYSGKIRREDLLANEDGSFPVPLQLEKVYNSSEYKEQSDDWKNMIVFGDNLQFLKTIYKDEDPYVCGKVKGKVKLIYIDPPFATSDDFQSKDGAKAYSDKKKGADFLEYLRKRLILAREIMASDSTIYVHLDSKMGHYVKVVMDEIFPTFEFSEIIWFCGLMGNGDFFPKSHETIYCYKSKNAVFNVQNKLGLSLRITKALQHDENGWYYTRGRETSGGQNCLKTYICKNPKLSKEEAIIEANKIKKKPVWSLWMGSKEFAELANETPVGTYAYRASDAVDYPTKKPEELLRRIILSSTDEGDLVLDFFAGSGTTAAVAEKLGRRWITCDIGKYSYFTVQKRLLQISESNDLDKAGSKYGKSARPFYALSLGAYDYAEIKELEFEKYKTFVSGLFDIKLESSYIGGWEFDGEKDGFPVIIFDYKKYSACNIDVQYLNDISAHISSHMAEGRVYIVSPANQVDFLTDYEEVDGVRYYFLKIPYQIIKELHQRDFKKSRQPKSKEAVNSLEESIGFSFNMSPNVSSEFLNSRGHSYIKINSFESKELSSKKSNKEKDLKGFECLSAVFIDRKHNGSEFLLSDVFFASDLVSKDGYLLIDLGKKKVGDKIRIIYSDIFGNDFSEIIETKISK